MMRFNESSAGPPESPSQVPSWAVEPPSHSPVAPMVLSPQSALPTHWTDSPEVSL
jgi:hypothetical protein